MVLLCIETSTDICSISISRGHLLLGEKNSKKEYSHTEYITVYIKELFDEVNLKMKQLDAVVISEGPGSYTALRVGASVAKSISHALNIPLIGVSSLEVLCYGAREIDKHSIYLPTIDARRMEIYAAYYNFEFECLKPTHNIILTENDIFLFERYDKIYVLGDGAKKTVEYFNSEKVINSNIIPHASYLIPSGINKYKSNLFEDLHKFEPKYFKGPNITKPKPIL